MSDFFEEAVRRTHLRFPGSGWDILTPQQRADAIWEEIHRIDASGGMRLKAPPQQADANQKHSADQVVTRRRRAA